MRSSRIRTATLLSLPKIHTESGNITAINNNIEIDFSIKRCYYLYDVPGGTSRGGHAHKKLHQLIVAGSGAFDVILDDGKLKRTVNLNQPDVGLYLPPGLWRELRNFSAGSICLVLASDKYCEEDYIRDYADFKIYKSESLND